MGKIRLAPGVWSNMGSFTISGAGAIVGATSEQEWLQIVGWVGMSFGLALLAWGITINGEHWWKIFPDLLSRHVWWRFGRSKPIAISRPHKVGLARPEFDEAKQEQFTYPYPKAVLKLRLQNPRGTRRGKPDGTPIAMSIAGQLQNDHTSDLCNCSVLLREIDGLKGGNSLVGLNFKLPKDGTVRKQPTLVSQFTIIRRNMEDEVTPEPFLLMVGGREVPLDENSTYSLLLELRSEYRYSTLAHIQIDTGNGLDAEARFVGEQKVTEIGNG